jgi:hypothetical protein
MTVLEDALRDAGGLAAPAGRTAQIRAALDGALRHGRDELARPRSGYEQPVEVAFAASAAGDALLALLPVDPALRADPEAVPDRAWQVVAGAVGALAEAADLPPPTAPGDLRLTAGTHHGFLVVAVPARKPDPELAALLLEERLEGVDRLRVAVRAVPVAVASPEDLRPPAVADHPLRAAEAIARLGGDPAHPESADDEELLRVLAPQAARTSPHADPDPGRRVARRIVQRLAGMGKWGSYHTAWDHLARGFAGNDRELAYAVGERLLDAGILKEKPSVGQRHVFLDPGRKKDIDALIERGDVPPGLRLP